MHAEDTTNCVFQLNLNLERYCTLFFAFLKAGQVWLEIIHRCATWLPRHSTEEEEEEQGPSLIVGRQRRGEEARELEHELELHLRLPFHVSCTNSLSTSPQLSPVMCLWAFTAMWNNIIWHSWTLLFPRSYLLCNLYSSGNKINSSFMWLTINLMLISILGNKCWPSLQLLCK